jgi:hypothetical protein
MVTLHEDLCTFMKVSRWILPRMRNVSDEICKENKNSHFIFNNFLRIPCYLWDNVENTIRVGQATDDNIVWSMRIACWITKATDAHSKYAILIVFPRQVWLCERASVLRYTYIACVVTTGSPRLTLALTTLFCFKVVLPGLNVVFTSSWWNLPGQTVGCFN